MPHIYFEKRMFFLWTNAPGKLPTCQRSSLNVRCYASGWVRFPVNDLLLERCRCEESQDRVITSSADEQVKREAVRLQDASLTITSTHPRIFSHSSPREKNIFSHFPPRGSHKGRSRSIFDCCTRLIRLIRFFSAEARSLTRRDSRPFAPHSLMGENGTLYSPGG